MQPRQRACFEAFPMKQGAFALPFAALLAIAPMQAHADFSASATMSNIRFTLTDLNLDDGIAPSLVPKLDGGAVTRDFSTWYEDNDARKYQSFSADPAYFDSRTVAFDTPTAGPKPNRVTGSVSIGGDSFDHFALAANATVAGTRQRTAGAGALLVRSFTLSPNTAVTITMDVTVLSGKTNANFNGYGTSSASFWIGNRAVERATHAVESLYQGSGTPGLLTMSTTYESQLGETSVDAYFWVNAYAWENGNGMPLPVPEPETDAILLVGLGMITWRQQRRRLGR
ncbi:PEP-CTERM sorting domain-containing protein [Massilia sp. CCM 8734]|nr:PEP-CTERM sorting domain-containing protein [Massilia sp. CCM 8734]